MTADMAIVADLDGRRKAFLTLRAKLALAGHTLSRTDSTDGPVTYCVGRWGMVRELRDLEAVQAFAVQVEAPL